MELKYVEDHTIFECIVGSQAYGTHTPESDEDRAGIMIPGKEYFLGLKHFEQFVFQNCDKTIFDIRKALNLIADNNPNSLDLLFTPERCIVKNTSFWEKVILEKSLFLSKKIRYTFAGHAIAQLKRIKMHRKFLLCPCEIKPKRQDYGLSEISVFPTSQIKAIFLAAIDFIKEEQRSDFVNELDKIYANYIIPLLASFLIPEQQKLAMEWLQLGIKSQCNSFTSLGTTYIKDEYIDQAQRELKYFDAFQEWKQYEEWKKTRNKKRADLEKKFGYDTKHSMHLVRLLKMAKEGLSKGQIFVDRTHIDAEELKEIRNGSWSYEQVEEYAIQQDKELNKLYLISNLPKVPDREKISVLCMKLVDSFYYYKNE